MALIDLSHTIEDGMRTYPDLPGPVVSDYLSREASAAHYAPGTTFHLGRIDLLGNTGTWVDAPFHRFAEGADVASLPLESLADLEGVVVRARAEASRAIGPEALAGLELAGKAILFHTGWSRHWRTPRYAEGHPFLTRAAAERLVEAGAALVGIDSLNVDDTADPERPVHTLLLADGIPIAEHLTGLAALPDSGFRFFAVPAKVAGMSSFPVRAFAVV